VNAEHRIEDLLRELAPQILGTLVRRHGQFAACEDAVQEALLAAALQWPTQGVPDRPRSWLLTVASRSLVDEWRSESARRRREETLAALEPAADQEDASHWPTDQDDTLALLFLCCHPALSPPSQLALTLRGAAHQPGQAAHQERWGPVRATAQASRAARRGLARALPHLQRRVHD